MKLRRLAGSLLALISLSTSTATSQVLGLPVINNGSVPAFGISAQYAQTNRYGGDFTTLGAELGVGMGIIGVKGVVSKTTLADEDVISYGGAAAVMLLGGPFIPFRVALQGGYGEWSSDGARYRRIPLSLGMAAAIPVPAFTLKPWVAPRVELIRSEISPDHEDDYRWGISGGIDLIFLNGITLRAAYDRTLIKGSRPGVLGLGVTLSP